MLALHVVTVLEMSDFGGDDDWAADGAGNDFDSLAIDADLGDDGAGDYENTIDAGESFDLNTLESETREFLGSGSAGTGTDEEDSSLLVRDGDSDDDLAASASSGFWWVEDWRHRIAVAWTKSSDPSDQTFIRYFLCFARRPTCLALSDPKRVPGSHVLPAIL